MNAVNLLNTKAATTAVGVLVASAVLYYVVSKILNKATDAARTAGNAVNPASDQNLAYRGVNAVGSALTGDEYFTFGGWLYDVTHPGEADMSYVPRKLAVREESKVYDWLSDNG